MGPMHVSTATPPRGAGRPPGNGVSSAGSRSRASKTCVGTWSGSTRRVPPGAGAGLILSRWHAHGHHHQAVRRAREHDCSCGLFFIVAT
eukprot:6278038-Pyramimonas_sp.AAC.1